MSITKKSMTVTIDEELLEKARKQIPNISGFLEECLNAYLGINKQSIFYATDAQELLEQIKNAQTALYLLTERNNIDENVKQVEIDKLNYAWRLLYTRFRDTRKIDKERLENAVKILNVPAEQLAEIVEIAHAYSNTSNIDITEWSEVYEEYKDCEW